MAALFCSGAQAGATQLVILSSPEGIYVGANGAANVVSQGGQERTVAQVCKIFHEDNTVAMDLGAEHFQAHGRIYGSLRLAIMHLLAKDRLSSFDQKKSDLEKAYTVALSEQVAAEKRTLPRSGWGQPRAMKSSFFMAMYEDDVPKSVFFTAYLTDWDKATLASTTWPIDLSKTNFVAWFQETPITQRVNVPSFQAASFLQSRMDWVHTHMPKQFEERMGPPFMLALQTQGRFSWLVSPGPCEARSAKR